MLRVLVVEERQAVRDGLKRLLALAGEITVVGETSRPAEAAENGAAPRLRPRGPGDVRAPRSRASTRFDA
jgi:DNA-binding NarL/FixJ family response regulator